MDNLTRQIGQRIRAARKARGMTQGELGKKTKLDQAYISRLENGTAEGSPAQILAIARAIGLSVAELYDETDAAGRRTDDLSDAAIELARAWQGLPAEQRAAMRAAVMALGDTDGG